MSESRKNPNSSELAPSSRQPALELPDSTNEHPNTVAELRQALRAREDLLAIAAHELRNPITPIQLSVELIKATLRAREYQKLDEQVERLERLLNQFLKRTAVLLDVSRLTAGKLNLSFAEFDLSELVRSIIDELNPILARSGSELRTVIEDNICCVLDRMAVGQILENLLTNAIKYGGGKPIEVRVSRLDQCAEIAVRDHGIGIDEEEKNRVFERFERAVREVGKPGFGIGLWVSRELAESMGGSITIVSEKALGSLFTVTLPMIGSISNG